jgi:hypothetical protein
MTEDQIKALEINTDDFDTASSKSSEQIGSIGSMLDSFEWQPGEDVK